MKPNGRRAWRKAAKKLRRTMGRRWRSQEEWVGADWKAGDIHDQVAREAVQKVQNLFGTCCHCGKERAHGQFQVVGEPEVEIVSQRKVKP